MKKKKSDLLLIDVIEQLPGNIFWLDCDNVVLGCNRGQAISVGVSDSSELVGKHLSEFIHPDCLEDSISNNARVLQEKRALVFEEKGLNNSGNERLFLCHKSPLYGSDGSVIGLVGSAQEITQLRVQRDKVGSSTAEQSLQEHQLLSKWQQLTQSIMGYGTNVSSLAEYVYMIREYYESIIALMPGSVFWLNLEGVVLGCNNHQAEALNMTRAELSGQSIFDIGERSQAVAAMENNRRVIANKKTISIEETVTLEAGVRRTFFSTKSPLIHRDGSVVGVLGVAIDITDRKIIEEELIEQRQMSDAANRAKSEFLMNMSHDLRTPCSGILGYAKLLCDQEEDVEKKERLHYIVKSSQRLLFLLNEIMDYTKIESSSYSITSQSFDLRKLLESVFGLLGAECQRKGLTRSIVYGEHTPDVFETDPRVLHRILLNLVSNAIKFTESGSISIEVDWDEGEQELSIHVKDTGMGIAHADLSRIFDKFTRLNASFSGEYTGAGLGLSIVESLAGSLSGRVSVKSELNKGSVFSCVVPVKKSTHKENELFSDDLGEVIKSPSFKTLNLSREEAFRVLVVEDDFISGKVCEDLFKSLGVDVVLCRSGNERLSQYLQGYHLIMMDIGLPGITGCELAKKIRQWEHQHINTDPVTIVALTAHLDMEHKMEYMDVFDAIMHKPLTKKKILQLL